VQCDGSAAVKPDCRCCGGIRVSVLRNRATTRQIPHLILGVAIFPVCSVADSKCSGSHGGYSSTVKMLPPKSNLKFNFSLSCNKMTPKK